MIKRSLERWGCLRDRFRNVNVNDLGPFCAKKGINSPLFPQPGAPFAPFSIAFPFSGWPQRDPRAIPYRFPTPSPVSS